MMIACLIRRLNDGVDYPTFRQAWIPDEILPGDPRTRVLSAVNLEDPGELLTVAIIEEGDPADIPGWMEKIAPIEQRRHERIKGLAGDPTVNAVYQVLAEDDLSRPLAAWPS
jgi:hypothetical protein